MAWESMAWSGLLTNPPLDRGDAKFHLSLHTASPATDENEFDPAEVPGYNRIPYYPGNTTALWYQRSGSGVVNSSVEWLMSFAQGAQGNDTPLSVPFTNRGAAAWPSAAACGLSMGPGSSTPRSVSDSRVARLTLGQPWSLAAGRRGLPPDNLRDFGVAKPANFADGGLYGQLNALSLPNLFKNDRYFVRTLMPGLDTDFNRYRVVSGQSDGKFNTPDERARYGDGFPCVVFALGFMNDAQIPQDGNGDKTGANITGTVAGIPGRPTDASFRLFPIMALSDDGTKLENKNDMAMNVTAPVTGADYWGLFDLSRLVRASQRTVQGITGNVIPWVLRDGHYYPESFSASQTFVQEAASLCFYGPVDSAVPALAVGEGVIPAGAISITL